MDCPYGRFNLWIIPVKMYIMDNRRGAPCGYSKMDVKKYILKGQPQGIAPTGVMFYYCGLNPVC
ncbi:MAG: hypothetical protein P794_01215 [Epsilonproteobacteria bacterium (ex Lamellibrachia satsuma)]|nr:MAG: hypothetical protein P794_01215 [Epsilonproteobacteria bacterium (ex Lamellibrachia satsuma)]